MSEANADTERKQTKHKTDYKTLQGGGNAVYVQHGKVKLMS